MGIMFNLEFSWSKVTQLIASNFNLQRERERQTENIFSVFYSVFTKSNHSLPSFVFVHLSVNVSVCLSLYLWWSFTVFAPAVLHFEWERERMFSYFILFFFFSSRWSNYSIPSFWIFLFDCYIIVCLFIYTFVVVVVFLFVSNVVFLICSHRFSRFGKKNVNTLK